MNKNPYPDCSKLLLAIDCIIFGYDISGKELKLLIAKRNFEPEKGKWSLAGEFVESDEGLDQAAKRILRKITGLESVYMKQSYCWGDTDRDPGGRVISVAYTALISIRDIDPAIAHTNSVYWWPLTRLPDLIFDHKGMVEKALSDLQCEVKTTPVSFELLPEKFTLVQLQALYEAIYQRDIDKRNFRKKILSMGILDKLDEKETETSRRGAFYYRFNKERVEQLRKGGFFFNLDVN